MKSPEWVMGAEPTATGTTVRVAETRLASEEYFGGKQRFRGAVDDGIGIEPSDEFRRR